MDESSRRSFLKSAALAVAGPSVLPALGANGRLNAGWIGTGSRGIYVMNMMYEAVPRSVIVTAVCDTFQAALAQGRDNVQSKGGNTPRTYVDYREVLADPSIDAVFIATPEHLHHQMALAALAAGKHIYLEKPLAHTIEEGWDIVNAAEKAGKVVQVGTQNRSNSLYLMARDMVQSGLIGEVHYVRAFWYRNSLESEPAWRYAIPPDLSAQTADWDRFLGPAPRRPFDARRYRQWRLYWDYSGGISTDLLVHQTDITNFVCGRTVPYSCMASGGIYRWTAPDDDREVPDTFSALYEYPESKFHINYSCYFGNDHFGYGEQFCGNDGTIEVLNRQFLNYYPEKFGGKPPARVASRKEINIALPANDSSAVQNHVKNFIEAIEGHAQLIAPPIVGQQAAISGHMATLSFRAGKKVIWEEQARKYRFV
jgi:predicted dehydrogenase